MVINRDPNIWIYLSLLLIAIRLFAQSPYLCKIAPHLHLAAGARRWATGSCLLLGSRKAGDATTAAQINGRRSLKAEALTPASVAKLWPFWRKWPRRQRPGETEPSSCFGPAQKWYGLVCVDCFCPAQARDIQALNCVWKIKKPCFTSLNCVWIFF